MPSTQVLPLLFVGDEFAAIAPEVHEFSCVLNITEEVPKSALLEQDVIFKRFPVWDIGGKEEQALMFSFFPTACSMIKQCLENNQPVLVHCAEGKQRSCSIICAFLSQNLGFSTLEAKAYLIARHPQAFDFDTCLHFGPALEKWQKFDNESLSVS